MKRLLFFIILYSLFEEYSLFLTRNKSEIVKEKLRSYKIQKPFEYFKDFEEIEQQLKSWAKNYSDLLTLEVISKTYENRSIYSLSIENATEYDNKSKPGVLIECGMHSREWISPAICLFLVNQALHNPQSQFSLLLASFNFYMLPMLNPDGYVYTWTHDRLWRKNRSPQENGCFGVDLNRNFDVDFCMHDRDTNPCSEIFCGSQPFSELEAQAFRDYATKLKNKNNLKHTFHIHSFGQQITYPYGYSETAEAPNHEELERIVQATKEHIKTQRGTVYRAGQSGKLIYEASGGSDDWSMKELGIESVYCIENQDTGNYGFMLSNNQIVNACDDCAEIITYILRYFINSNHTEHTEQ